MIEILNWAELPARNDPSQACRKFLQKYTATIYNRCFSLKNMLRLKVIHCVSLPILLRHLKFCVYVFLKILPLKQSFLTRVSKRQFTTGIRSTKESTWRLLNEVLSKKSSK